MRKQTYYLLQPVVTVWSPKFFRFLQIAVIALVKCSKVMTIDVTCGSFKIGKIPVLIIPELVWERRYKQESAEQSDTLCKPPQRQTLIEIGGDNEPL